MTRPLTLALAVAFVLAGCGAAPPASPTPAERTVIVEPTAPAPEVHVVNQTVIVIENRTVTVVRPSPTPRVRIVTRTVPVDRTVTVVVTPTPTATPTATATPEPAVGDRIEFTSRVVYHTDNGTDVTEVKGTVTNAHRYTVQFTVELLVYDANGDVCVVYEVRRDVTLEPGEERDVSVTFDSERLRCDSDFEYQVDNPERVEKD